jgi:hypothetical protein
MNNSNLNEHVNTSIRSHKLNTNQNSTSQLEIKDKLILQIKKNEIKNMKKNIKESNTDFNNKRFDKAASGINNTNNYNNFKYDKKRELDSLELKKAIYTIIKIMIEELNFKPIKNLKTMIVLSNLNDVFEYLEQNWFESDAREYLLFFIKPK